MSTEKFARIRHAYIAVRDLKPHPLVQRDFDMTRAKRLAAEFDPDKFGELAVSSEGGQFWVWDGQTRHWAANAALGADQTVPCAVYEDIPVARLADLFLGRSDTKQVKAIDRFRIAVLAKAPAETRIEAVMHEFGLKIGHNYQVGIVRCPVAMKQVFDRGGENILRRVLRIAHSAWQGDVDAFDGTIVSALGKLVLQFSGDLDDGEMARKLSRFGGPGRMIGIARDYAKTMGVPLARATAERMLNIYNKGRRTRALDMASSAPAAASQPSVAALPTAA